MSTGNTKYGDGSLSNNSTIGGNNSAFGIGALKQSSKKWNTSIGAYSGLATTTGISNTGVGTNTLLKNTTGSYNTALGTAAMCFNTTGTQNTVMGSNTMENNTTGQNNTAIGTRALYNNLSGINNVALGSKAGFNNSGNNNTFLGTDSNATNPYSSSTAIGYNSQIDADNQIKMGLDTTQVVIPGSAILTKPSGSTTYTNNSIVPKSYIDLLKSGITLTESCVCATTTNIDLVTGGTLTIDGYTTIFGDRVLVKSQGAASSNENTANIANGIYIVASGAWTRALDNAALTYVAGYLTFVQNGTLNSNTAFAELTDPGVVGTDALQYSIFYSNPYTLGNGLEVSALTLRVRAVLSGFLTFVGINGGTNTTYSLDSGSKDIIVNGLTVGKGPGSVSTNTAIGSNALKINLTGANNTAIGSNALSANTASYNTAIGSNALQKNIAGTANTAIGFSALSANTASNNTAIGHYALSANTDGLYNVAIGQAALINNKTGAKNTAIGYYSLSNMTGSSNTALGFQAGNTLTTGSSNTALGYQAGNTLTTGSNVTCIGNGAQPSSGSSSNQMILGNSSINYFYCAATQTTTSDARDKKDIKELEAGLNFVEQLKPVSFIWNMRDGGKKDIPDTGFIAQDLKQVQIDTGITIPGLVYDANPEKLEASYGKLLPVLVKAIQDLKKELDELKAQMNL